MEQAQIRVRLPVGTKLLAAILLLLITVIGFLDVSTILILAEDKRAYTYQAQANETLLAGREFTSLVKRSLDTLRLSLSNVDPGKAISPQERARLSEILDNQSEILSLSMNLLNPANGDATPLVRIVQEELAKAENLNPASLTIERDWVKAVLPEVVTKGFALANVSRLGSPPLVALLLGDVKLKDFPAGMPVAIGIMSLQDFATALGGSDLTIASPEGWTLFSTDGEALYTRRNVSDDPLFRKAKGSAVTRGSQEYEHGGTRLLGSYYNLNYGAVVLTRTTWQKAMQATAALTEQFALLGGMAVGLAIMFALVFAKSISAPLARLYEATKKVASGDFHLVLPVIGRDEFAALSGSFNSMAARIQSLIEETAENARIEGELAIASTVQQTLIPPPKFDHPKIYIRSHYQSASECGGDWWGSFGVGDKIALMIADATGHGIPSALITASARSCFSVMHKLAQEDKTFHFSPGEMLSFANRVIYDASGGKIMMTFWIGVIDFQAMTLTYANAGHNPPWLFTRQGGAYKMSSLVSKGQRAGETQNAPAFAEKSVKLSPGDVLFLYTDGLLEGTNSAGAQFGKKRTRQLVEKLVGTGPDAIVDGLMKDFIPYNGDKPFDDDVTLAVAKVK
ncbi:MAG: SpoIIE family protein phosphatase [Bdellovibrionales bacterium]|nr:SpoIIE family protein phosphatase [Bdellovibrionales bacterium]